MIEESETPSSDTDDLQGPDEQELQKEFERDQAESLKFDQFVEACPACRRPITLEMDSCPYCGDILFRHLRDGTFVPRRGPWATIFTVLVIILIALGIIMFIWAQLH